MNRVIAGAFLCAAFFVCSHRPASAMVEFCPATLKYQRVGPESAKKDPAKIYGFELTALGTRTVISATLAFDTSAGWYTLDVPAITLYAKERRYTAPWVSFTRRDFVSPVLYVRFPTAVTIAHAWVYNASARDDGAFGWQAMGTVTCDPPATASPEQRKSHKLPDKNRYALDPRDDDGLSREPQQTSLIVPAASSKALESIDCAEPFRDAETKRIAVANYPDAMRGNVLGDSTTAVQVAIEPDGTLQDAWVWGPSGFTPFDQESVKAARNSTYTGARAYCRPVSSEYFFFVTFDPSG